MVCAAKILAESSKDRRADEFLELMDAIEKHGEKLPKLKRVKEDFSAIPDEAFDVHTVKGRRMGRGNLYWYEVSSKTENKSVDYEIWRQWWEPLIVETVRKEDKKEGKE